MKNNNTIWERYYIHSLITLGVVFLFWLFWSYNSLFYTAIIDYKWVNWDAFDGTIYPIEFVPDPLQLKYEERKQDFDKIDSKYFIKTPIYNPDILSKNLDDLKYWTPDYNNTITQRVTFTVPYLWNYKLDDYKEYTWSHPWIDIVSPKWTPIKNIANWFVVDVWNQPAWFWNYIIVKYSNILINWKNQNIYGLYAHMSKWVVQIGTKIKKWDLIWYVWDTWTATTPHLHFQIDLEDAPYKPYWPFSTADMKKAWVWFFEAINIWLGKEEAILYTLNSLKFVNDNLNYTLFAWWNSDEKLEEEKKEEVLPPIVDNVEKEDVKGENNLENTNSWTNVEKDDEIIPPKENDFSWNSLTQLVQKESVLTDELELLSAWWINDFLVNDSKVKDLDLLELKKEDENIDDTIQEDIKTNSWSDLVENTNKDENIDKNIEDTKEKIFLDIPNDYKYYNELKYLKDNNIITWFLDNTFKPKNNITRAEVLKIILLWNKINPIIDEKSIFKDIKTNTWENSYINAWVNLGIIDKENKYFYPFRNVSRVEWLKLILELSKVNLDDIWQENISLKDVKNDDWYYKYVVYAIKNNLLSYSNDKFEPNKPLNREEMIYILYNQINKEL